MRLTHWRRPEVRWEWKPQDFRVGIYWAYRPHDCSFDVCYNNEWHLWLCLVPMLPIHFRRLVRSEKQAARESDP